MSPDAARPGSPYGAKPERENPKALWALIMGVVSLFLTAVCLLGSVLGIAAVVLGWQAKDQPTGKWLARIGIALGVLSVVVGLISMMLVVTGAVQLQKP